MGNSERGARRRRVKRRHVALVVAVLAVGLSERFGGPFTVEALSDAVVTAVDDVVDRFDETEDEAVSSAVDGAADTAVGSAFASGDGGEIHLTFDDGPSPHATSAILDLLAEHDATAVFFPIGSQVGEQAALMQRAVAEGHLIGNHTWNHDPLPGLSRAQFDETIGRAQVAIAQATGVTPTCLRPPGGAIDDVARSHAAAAGLSVEMWTVDPRDWQQPGAAVIEEVVLAAAEPGSVVLLHDGGGDRTQTVEALGGLLDELADRGYRFTALPGC